MEVEELTIPSTMEDFPPANVICREVERPEKKEEDSHERLVTMLEEVVERLLDRRLGAPPTSHDLWKEGKRTALPQPSGSKDPLRAEKKRMEKKGKDGTRSKAVTTLNPPANPGKSKTVTAPKKKDKKKEPIAAAPKQSKQLPKANQPQATKTTASGKQQQQQDEQQGTWAKVVGRRTAQKERRTAAAENATPRQPFKGTGKIQTPVKSN